ncbi:MAG: glycosyl hydrolase [Verrucomicrobiales bacterium]
MIRLLSLVLVLCHVPLPAQTREWLVKGAPGPVEAEFVAFANGHVLLRGGDGSQVELPLGDFSQKDQAYLRILTLPAEEKGPFKSPGAPLSSSRDYRREERTEIKNEILELKEALHLHLSSASDPLPGSLVHLAHPDAWLVFTSHGPDHVIRHFLDRILVRGQAAKSGENVRVLPFGGGRSVVIPHSPAFPALTLFAEEDLGGASASFHSYEAYDEEKIGPHSRSAASFLLKRGYMATLASDPDGTGFSKNYVAQDHDLRIDKLPAKLRGSVRFIRVFPWRWTEKKGIAGNIGQSLGVSWFYNWNLDQHSSPDIEYVAIKQKHGWPSLNQDWRRRGINHLLGFNEPDRPDQANMSVETALRLWPELLGTGLRLGSPATSDGGLGWLYHFMEEAGRRGLRVDFVAVHYYRSVASPRDDRGAAQQMYNFLKEIHERTGRPLWVTEWNNGANWTPHPDPDAEEQLDAIKAMTKMLDEAPFVERYAPYNWVEDGRRLVWDDGGLTPAGKYYRELRAPLSYQQPRKP